MSTEKETQKAILQYLEAKRIFHYRNNSGATKTEHGSFLRYGYPGSPDIIAVVKGTYIGIEVKDIKGKLSPSQIAFQKELEKAGGIYIVARDIDTIIDIFE